MRAVPKVLVAVAFVTVATLAHPVKSQPAPRTDPPSTDAPLPAMQRFELRRDTFAEREEFLKRRAAEMREQNVEQVAPLPAQQIRRAPSRP